MECSNFGVDISIEKSNNIWQFYWNIHAAPQNGHPPAAAGNNLLRKFLYFKITFTEKTSIISVFSWKNGENKHNFQAESY